MVAAALILENLNRYIGDNPGIEWTVRQLYYRLVSDQIIPNNLNSYKGFDKQLVHLREAGEVDDNIFVDTARRIEGGDSQDDGDIDDFFQNQIQGLASDGVLYGKSMWDDQKYNLIFVLEKDALSRLVGSVTNGYRVPLAIGRGYSSRTQILDIANYLKDDKENVLLYLGDHDPTGLDIERSCEKRLDEESGGFNVTRVALTYEQTEKWNLPPNPTKSADARTPEYRARFGNECWELDALPPKDLQSVVREAILKYIDMPIWEKTIKEERRGRRILEKRFENAADVLKDAFPEGMNFDDEGDEGKE